MTISLRRTALVWMTALLTIVGIVAFGIAYQLAWLEATDFMDGQLRQIALNVGDGAGLTTAAGKHDAEDDFVITIWSIEGKTLRLSPNGLTLPRQPQQGFATIRALGDEWRVYLAGDTHRTVQVGQRTGVRREMAETAAIQAGTPILVVIPLAWLLIGWSLSRVLRRMSGLARLIAGRSVDSRTHIPVVDVPVEIRPIVDAMNILTDRLQRALEQQKRFVANAAHELRTPLAALQLQIGNINALAGGQQTAPVAELDKGIRRAKVLVEQLLQLARTEAPAQPEYRDIVDLTALITQCVADFVPIAAARGVDLGLLASDAVSISGWAGDLAMLFGNLIDNAIRYTPRGGAVDVCVRKAKGAMTVEIVDTGCGVAEANIARLCERFFRAAPADIDGSGLGLSIADAVVQRHGLTMVFANRLDRAGLRVRVAGRI